MVEFKYYMEIGTHIKYIAVTQPGNMNGWLTGHVMACIFCKSMEMSVKIIEALYKNQDT